LADFEIGGVEPLGSATTVLVHFTTGNNKMATGKVTRYV
jgi:hypothetical protein